METTVLTSMDERCPAPASSSLGRRSPGGRPGSVRAAPSRRERRPGCSFCPRKRPGVCKAGSKREKSGRRWVASGGVLRRRTQALPPSTCCLGDLSRQEEGDDGPVAVATCALSAVPGGSRNLRDVINEARTLHLRKSREKQLGHR